MELKRSKRRKEQPNHTITKEVNGSPLLLLPVHLIFNIFDRLPIYTILTCKCVCNTLKHILSDPYFAQLHFAKASRDGNSLVIQDGNDPSKIFMAPLVDLDKHALYPKTDNYPCSWQTLTPPAFMPKTKKYPTMTILVGSSNGLLCVRYFANNVIRLCVCNPILGEFTTLPCSKELKYEVGGFGFCPKTQKYKVLRFFPESRLCEILTLGTDNNWRRICDAPPLPAKSIDLVSSYKGNLHWIFEVCKKPKENMICFFNLATERYSFISLLSFFNNHPNVAVRSYLNHNKPEIGTLDGLFCVSFFSPTGQFEAYVIEGGETNGSWIKRVSIDTAYTSSTYGECNGKLRFLDNGVLVIRRPTCLIFHDTRKGTTSDILLMMGLYSSACFHQQSLVSLKDIVRRENVDQVERKMLHITLRAQGK